jgi:membrane associated rhomboid family serine protease
VKLEWETGRDASPLDAWATVTLIVASVILSVQEFQGADFAVLHADYREMPQETWRYLTCTLLHGGWLHLAMNLLWLLQLGVLTEALLGLGAYSVLIVVLATAATAAQWALSGPCVGLSGIVYGLFGVLWALDRWHPRCRGVMNKRTTEAFAAWFLICVLITWADLMPIGNTAHAMGFIVGALAGWSLAAEGARRLMRLGLLASTLALVGVAQVPAVRDVINRSQAYEHELFNRGYDAIGDEDYELAVELYEEVTRRAPEFHEAWNNLAVALAHLGRYREAERAGERADEAARAASD